MAVVNVKSNLVTNLDASPRTLGSPNLYHGIVREQVGYAAIANGDSIGSTYRVGRVRTSDRMRSIELLNDAIATSGAADIGAYRTAAAGGAVIDADCWASAVALTSARTAPLDATFEAGAAGGLNTNIEKRIWEVLGFTSDPMIEVDVVLTLTAAAGGAGNVAVRITTVGSN